MTWIALIIGIFMLIMALAAIYSKKIAVAVIAAGIVSLLASILYLILAAPDVAMTEAAIGSGLATIIFFYAINKIRKQNHD
ncbi:MAG: hydrogenase subunit MbhD domain-containing protein [Bacteroidota bacterium]